MKLIKLLEVTSEDANICLLNSDRDWEQLYKGKASDTPYRFANYWYVHFICHSLSDESIEIVIGKEK